jgi:hypothetical protein
MQSDHKAISVCGGVIARNVSAQPKAAVMTDDEDAESVRQSRGEARMRRIDRRRPVAACVRRFGAIDYGPRAGR